ncbi:MAG: hypothetical protein FWE42_00165 [Defluviitaleaceae bacterium]|nr:hypothetical protein [Defluviitaleaceae bacterium]
MRGYEFQRLFVKKLIDIGFPEESIAVEYEVAKGSMIDVAIIDRATSKLLLIFELKVASSSSMNMTVRRNGEEQLRKHIAKLDNIEVPAFLIVMTESGLDVLPFESNDEGKRGLSPSIDLDALLPYITLLNGSRASAINDKKKEIKKTIDWFRVVCWVCAGALVVLVMFDIVFDCINISATQLSLIGISIALVLIPFAQKLKVLGVEFERLTIEKRDNEK